MRLPDRETSRAVLIGTKNYASDGLLSIPAVRNCVDDLAIILADGAHAPFAREHCSTLLEVNDPREAYGILRDSA